MDKFLFLQERFIVSDVQVPSISEKLETPTEEMREDGIQREIEVQVHRAESEGSVDPHVVFAVSPVSPHEATVLPEVTNGVSLGGENHASQARSAATRKSGRNKRVPQRFQASVEFFIYFKYFYFIKYLNDLKTDLWMYLI